MKHPTAGQIVHVFADPAQNNGADISPAIITRAWDHTPGLVPSINVRVFADGPDARWVTSIPLYETREAAQEYADKRKAEWEAASSQPYPCTLIAAFWPPHVGEPVHETGDVHVPEGDPDHPF